MMSKPLSIFLAILLIIPSVQSSPTHKAVPAAAAKPTSARMDNVDAFLFCKMRAIVRGMSIIARVQLLRNPPGLSNDDEPEFCKDDLEFWPTDLADMHEEDHENTRPTLQDMNMCDEFLFCTLVAIVKRMNSSAQTNLMREGLSGHEEPSFCIGEFWRTLQSDHQVRNEHEGRSWCGQNKDMPTLTQMRDADSFIMCKISAIEKELHGAATVASYLAGLSSDANQNVCKTALPCSQRLVLWTAQQKDDAPVTSSREQQELTTGSNNDSIHSTVLEEVEEATSVKETGESDTHDIANEAEQSAPDKGSMFGLFEDAEVTATHRKKDDGDFETMFEESERSVPAEAKKNVDPKKKDGAGNEVVATLPTMQAEEMMIEKPLGKIRNLNSVERLLIGSFGWEPAPNSSTLAWCLALVIVLCSSLKVCGVCPHRALQIVPATASISGSQTPVLDEEDLVQLEYKPLIQFVDNPPCGELRACSEYVASACAICMPEVWCVADTVREVSVIAMTKLSNPAVANVLESCRISPAMLFAIVCYTFDLCLLIIPTPEEDLRNHCFYHVLNKNLRRRDPLFLQQCHGYLYYLMTGLHRLPPFEGSAFLFRGIDADGAPRARTEYVATRIVHWSAFSSASPNALLDFAAGGLLLRIRILELNSRSRDIALFSAFGQMESEVLLLPNMRMIVDQEAHFDEELGLDVIDLRELADLPTDVF